MKSVFPTNGTHFFLDIGLSENAGTSLTKHLEESGWHGVCANPFPDETRSCKSVAVPVAPVGGNKVEVSDCSTVSGLQSMFSTVKAECPKVERTALGIGEILLLSKAPPVIDFFALDSKGSEREILENFPFSKFCVRSWAIQHRFEPETIGAMLKILDSRGCSVSDAGPAFWARCKCSGFAQTLLAQKENSSKSISPGHNKKAARNQKQKHGGKQHEGILVPSFEQQSDMSIEIDSHATSPAIMRKN